MPKKTRRNAQTPVKEIWKDRHFHLVKRDSFGHFHGHERYHKPLAFKQTSGYTYVVKYKDGTKNGKILTIDHPRLIQLPRHSWQRKQLYKALTQKYASYDFQTGRMVLLSTYDNLTGKRRIPN